MATIRLKIWQEERVIVDFRVLNDACLIHQKGRALGHAAHPEPELREKRIVGDSTVIQQTSELCG